MTNMNFALKMDHAVLVSYTGTEEYVCIPDFFQEVPVTQIGERAFYENEHLRFLQIPESITVIGDAAMKGCRHLQCVSFQPIELPETPAAQWLVSEGGYLSLLPKALQQIGAEAFRYTALETLSSSTVKLTIDPSAFQNCMSLREVNMLLCEKLHMKNHAFAACKNLESFYAFKARAFLGQFTFGSCNSLTFLFLNGEPHYSGDTFYGCPKIQSFQRYDDGRFSIDPNTMYKIIKSYEKEIS